jgi:periplasmic protein TonB
LPLPIAFALSLVLHLALYALADRVGLRAPPAPASRPRIEAMLIVPQIAPLPKPLPPPALPLAPDVPRAVPPPAETITARVRSTPASPPPAPDAPAARFYPPLAVLRGLEGEVLVGVTLDARGDVVAARLERGSGHAILDEAALRAALTLKSLPGGRGEAVLPVRFRLR